VAEEAGAQPIDPGLLANFVFDRGDRRPDGTFLVPKSLQRLFEIRTARAVAADLPVTVTLAGRIVPDRHIEADVEASLLGRIEAPPGGLPVLGDSVTRGQVLAYVIPAVGVVDRTQVRREVARLTTLIRVETENLEILKQFSFVPFRDGKIYQSEQRIEGLRRERDTLLPLLQTQEELRAATAGVISVSTAVLGAIVHPSDKIFEIVNPNRLWVEALAPDPTVAANAQRVMSASAVTTEGQALTLSFIGTGLAMEQQSAPILFRIDNPPEGLRVGRPVTVTVQSGSRMQHGLPMTRDALTIGPDGVQEVWEQAEPEVFLPHIVRTIDLDGQRVLVVDGLKEGAHVVTQGVRLLAQLQ
jgi:membrane fusion protein, heavy metal efflux system